MIVIITVSLIEFFKNLHYLPINHLFTAIYQEFLSNTNNMHCCMV